MPLAHAFSPERIRAPLRQNRFRIQTVQREHSRVPSHRNNPNLSALFRRLVHIAKILRNSGMGIKTVNRIKIRRNLRPHHWQIRCRTTAKHHDVYLVLHGQHIVHMQNRRSLRVYFHRSRLPSREHGFQFHIFIAGNGKLHAPSDISISDDSNSNFLHNATSLFLFSAFTLHQPSASFNIHAPSTICSFQHSRSPNDQQISAPAGISFSGVISARFPSASSAHRSIPSDSTPASFAGFRFTRTMTFFPTISSGL